MDPIPQIPLLELEEFDPLEEARLGRNMRRIEQAQARRQVLKSAIAQVPGASQLYRAVRGLPGEMQALPTPRLDGRVQTIDELGQQMRLRTRQINDVFGPGEYGPKPYGPPFDFQNVDRLRREQWLDRRSLLKNYALAPVDYVGDVARQIPGVRPLWRGAQALPGQVIGQLQALPGQLQALPGQLQALPGQVQALPGQVRAAVAQIPGARTIYQFTRSAPERLAAANERLLRFAAARGIGGGAGAELPTVPSVPPALDASGRPAPPPAAPTPGVSPAAAAAAGRPGAGAGFNAVDAAGNPLSILDDIPDPWGNAQAGADASALQQQQQQSQRAAAAASPDLRSAAASAPGPGVSNVDSGLGQASPPQPRTAPLAAPPPGVQPQAGVGVSTYSLGRTPSSVGAAAAAAAGGSPAAAAAAAAAAAGAPTPASPPAGKDGGKFRLSGGDFPMWNPVDALNARAEQARQLAATASNADEAARAGRAATRYAGAASKLGLIGRLAGPVAAVAAPVMAFANGTEEYGVGGGVIQAGASGLGAMIGAPAGPLGAIAGGVIGDAVGKALSRGAAYAVEKAQSGTGGPIGSLGGMLDPFIDTPYERELAGVLRDLNSPLKQMADSQLMQQRRSEQMEADRQLVMQLALRGMPVAGY